jgi:hypothetical protein
MKIIFLPDFLQMHPYDRQHRENEFFRVISQRFSWFLWLLVFVHASGVLLSSCSVRNHESQDAVPGVPIPFSEMNTRIILNESVGMNEVFAKMKIIDLHLENLSNRSISFPPNYNLMIFIKNNDMWDPVENTYYYPDSGSLFLPTKKEYPPGMIVSLSPELKQALSPVTLRILVMGTIVDTGEKVGAYLDIILK